jgi:tetratricopeptide (TPR) repeat protein
MSFSSVNLMWQKRMRGLMPISPRCVTDDGTAILIRPDEFESRTYQVLAVRPDGGAQELSAIAVETISKFVALPDGKLMLGMTNDDVYIFRDGRKTRFMPDQHVAYADVDLAPDSGWFICGFADSLYASHALALGDPNGRVGWTKDLRRPVNRVAITRDGRTMVAGFQDGRILALDQMRTTVWECVHEEPISALCLGATGGVCAAGTEHGTVLGIDGEGGFRWKCAVGLPIVAIATDAACRWTAALGADAAAGLLTCVTADGAPAWEYDFSSRPTGLALSPNGKYLLVSASDGSAWMFELDLAAGSAAGPIKLGGRELEAARAAAESGDLTGARAALLALLGSAPHAVEAGGELVEIERRLVAEQREQARAFAEQGQPDEGMRLLDAAAEVAPWDAELFQERLAMRERAVEAAVLRARMMEGDRYWDGAVRAWTEVLSFDPTRIDAREALLRIREVQAAQLLSAGDERQAAGDVLNAVALWQQAQNLYPSDELRDRLTRAEVDHCLAAGIAHYEAHRMPEAAFQFKKVLALDPGNEPAHKYLGYAEGMTGGDNLVADRFARLE